VKKSKANLSISLKKIDETILRAPIAGTIIKKMLTIREKMSLPMKQFF